MFGQLLSVAERLLQFAEMLRFTAFYSEVGISLFDAGLLGANSLSIRPWAYKSSLQVVLVLHNPSWCC